MRCNIDALILKLLHTEPFRQSDGGENATRYFLRFARQMDLTTYHARHFSRQPTKLSNLASIESLTSALAEAQVDRNPHQIEAEFIAFHSPLFRGPILADEVGPGKTIEASLLLSQCWAEHRAELAVNAALSVRKSILDNYEYQRQMSARKAYA